MLQHTGPLKYSSAVFGAIKSTVVSHHVKKKSIFLKENLNIFTETITFHNFCFYASIQQNKTTTKTVFLSAFQPWTEGHDHQTNVLCFNTLDSSYRD